MANQIPYDENNIPTQIPNPASGLLNNNNFFIAPARLKNVPTVVDKQINVNANQQILNDSRTITSWMELTHRLITAAFTRSDGTIDILFTQDYGLLPEDPQSLEGVIIVHEVYSKIPAKMGSVSERKPRVREVINNPSTVIGASGANTYNTPQAAYKGNQWIWGQSFDVIMGFTVYAATWSKMYEWLQKFEDFMLTYSSIFIQTGLQQIRYREETRDALFDPPRTEEFPNKSIFYDVRVERQTKINYAEVEQILISAGVIDPVTGTSTEQLLTVETGVPSSPILPGPNQ